jgi:hypothetical protein
MMFMVSPKGASPVFSTFTTTARLPSTRAMLVSDNGSQSHCRAPPKGELGAYIDAPAKNPLAPRPEAA